MHSYRRNVHQFFSPDPGIAKLVADDKWSALRIVCAIFLPCLGCRGLAHL
jgi:hypothetical protein